jgi:hypothetical protein
MERILAAGERAAQDLPLRRTNDFNIMRLLRHCSF